MHAPGEDPEFTHDKVIKIQVEQLAEAIDTLRVIAENIDLAEEILKKKALVTQKVMVDNDLSPYRLWRGGSITHFINNELPGLIFRSLNHLDEIVKP